MALQNYLSSIINKYNRDGLVPNRVRDQSDVGYFEIGGYANKQNVVYITFTFTTNQRFLAL